MINRERRDGLSKLTSIKHLEFMDMQYITLQNHQMQMLKTFAYTVRPLMEPKFAELQLGSKSYDSDPLTSYVLAP